MQQRSLGKIEFGSRYMNEIQAYPGRKLPPLASLRAFEAAARHMSFKQAAEELAVTPTAISHQVRLLEDTLGVRLFERRTRQIALTKPGRDLFPEIREALDRIAASVEAVTADAIRPTVVLTTTTAFATHWLIPRLDAFRDRIPGIALSVLATDDVINLDSGRADLAVRLTTGGSPNNAADVLIEDRFVPMASPSVPLAAPSDLIRARLIDYDWRREPVSKPDWATWFAKMRLGHPPAANLHFNEESHALQAAVAGQGVGLFSVTIAASALRNGLLRIPFSHFLKGPTYHLATGRSRSNRDAIETVRTWLLTEVDADAAAAATLVSPS